MRKNITQYKNISNNVNSKVQYDNELQSTREIRRGPREEKEERSRPGLHRDRDPQASRLGANQPPQAREDRVALPAAAVHEHGLLSPDPGVRAHGRHAE